MVRSLVYVKEADYENVELWYSDLPDWVGNTIREALDDLSLRPYSIHLPKFLVSFDDKQFRDVVDSSFSFIETLGIKVAVLHLPEQNQLTSKMWAKRCVCCSPVNGSGTGPPSGYVTGTTFGF